MWELNLMLKWEYRRPDKSDENFIKFLKDGLNTTEQLVEMFKLTGMFYYFTIYGITEKELTKVINYIRHDYPD